MMFNILDPLGVNRNNVSGAFMNPIGQSFKAGTPAPMFDPFGYLGGVYKPGSVMGNLMNGINDPLRIFKNQRGLL